MFELKKEREILWIESFSQLSSVPSSSLGPGNTGHRPSAIVNRADDHLLSDMLLRCLDFFTECFPDLRQRRFTERWAFLDATSDVALRIFV